MRKTQIFILMILLWLLAACTPGTDVVSVTRPVEETAALETIPPTPSPTALATFTPVATATPFPLPTRTPTVVATPTPLPLPSPMPAAAGNQSNGRSNDPLLSADGRFVAFVSAGALTENALNDGQLALFVRDWETETTHLASVTLDGRPPFDDIYGFALSADGSTVAYYSFDNNLTADDSCPEEDAGLPCEDLFVADWQTGVTTRIPLGRAYGLGKDYTVALSPDGRFVAYDNLQLFDRQTGQPVSIFPEPPDGHTFAPAFAANGDMAFVSAASNLVPDDNNETYDVFVWEAATGQITRVSVAADGGEGNDVSGAMPFHEGVGDEMAISGNGRFVAFVSLATSLTSEPVAACDDYRGGTRSCYHLYLHDRETGETRLVAGGNGDSYQPALSDDGRFLAFGSLATNLIEGVPPCEFPAIVNCGHIYLLDIQSGDLSLISRSPTGEPGNGGSSQPDIDADGRFVAFESRASNLVPGDTNNASDIFLYDREAGQIERVSLRNN